MKNQIAQLLSIALITAFAGMANATSINFEELGTQPNLFSSADTLDNQYAALGVTFGGGWEILNEGGNFGVPARSGQHFAAYNTMVAGITDTMTMTFSSIMSSASGLLGDGGRSDWVVSALLGGSLVSQLNLTNPTGDYVEFSFAGLAFDQIEIEGFSYAAVVDDLSFEAASVPEPASLLLMGLGLAGLGLSRRKRA